MKIEINSDFLNAGCTVTITDTDSVGSNRQPEPNLYPGLKSLENLTSADIVNHVLHNRPQVRWVLETTDGTIQRMSDQALLTRTGG